MQVNIVQTLSQTTTSKTSEKIKDSSGSEKDFNEVLKSEQQANEAKETEKEQPKNQEEAETTQMQENTAVLLMPNVQELLNNIKNQSSNEKVVDNQNLLPTEQTQEILGLSNETLESKESDIKILDVNLLKSKAEIPKELADKINSLVSSEKKSSESDLPVIKTSENTQMIMPEQTSNVNDLVSTTTVQAPVVNQTMSAEYVSEINNLIADNIAMGKTDFEIQLNPENLGSLTIKASFEDGRSVVSIICSDIKALEAVQKGADDLALILQNKTGQQTQIILETPKSDYLDNQNEHHNGNSQNQQNENQGKDENENSQDFLQQLRLGLMEF